MNFPESSVSKRIRLEKEKKDRRLTLPILKTYFKVTIIKSGWYQIRIDI